MCVRVCVCVRVRACDCKANMKITRINDNKNMEETSLIYTSK